MPTATRPRPRIPRSRGDPNATPPGSPASSRACAARPGCTGWLPGRRCCRSASRAGNRTPVAASPSTAAPTRCSPGSRLPWTPTTTATRTTARGSRLSASSSRSPPSRTGRWHARAAARSPSARWSSRRRGTTARPGRGTAASRRPRGRLACSASPRPTRAGGARRSTSSSVPGCAYSRPARRRSAASQGRTTSSRRPSSRSRGARSSPSRAGTLSTVYSMTTATAVSRAAPSCCRLDRRPRRQSASSPRPARARCSSTDRSPRGRSASTSRSRCRLSASPPESPPRCGVPSRQASPSTWASAPRRSGATRSWMPLRRSRAPGSRSTAEPARS